MDFNPSTQIRSTTPIQKCISLEEFVQLSKLDPASGHLTIRKRPGDGKPNLTISPKSVQESSDLTGYNRWWNVFAQYPEKDTLEDQEKRFTEQVGLVSRSLRHILPDCLFLQDRTPYIQAIKKVVETIQNQIKAAKLGWGPIDGMRSKPIQNYHGKLEDLQACLATSLKNFSKNLENFSPFVKKLENLETYIQLMRMIVKKTPELKDRWGDRGKKFCAFEYSWSLHSFGIPPALHFLENPEALSKDEFSNFDRLEALKILFEIMPLPLKKGLKKYSLSFFSGEKYIRIKGKNLFFKTLRTLLNKLFEESTWYFGSKKPKNERRQYVFEKASWLRMVMADETIEDISSGKYQLKPQRR